MQPGRRLRVLLLATGAAGVVAIAGALAGLPGLPPASFGPLALLAALTLAAGRFSVKVPGRSVRISVSEIFVFVCIQWFGPGPAVLIVALDGSLMSLRQEQPRLYRAVFNVAEPAVSVACAGWAYAAALHVAPTYLRAGPDASAFLATLALTGTFFAFNSGLNALAVAFESDSSPAAVWQGQAMHLGLNYYAAGALAAVIAPDRDTLNLQAVGFVVPLLVLSFITYREATTRVDEAERHAVEVERLSAEARRRDEALRQSQKLEALGRLAGGVAHDFNNMLMAMRGYGELVAGALPADDPLQQDVGEILTAADRAAALTRQLLAFSRGHVAEPRVIRPDQTVIAMDKMIRRLIGEDIALTTTLAPDVARVKIDAGQLEQVLMNLALNGRDAMPSGGRLAVALGNVTLTAEQPAGTALAPGEYVRLLVQDTGCGMTDEVKARVFEPFFTTKSEGRGTGLGLAMVYGIVDRAGGAITIDTAVGIGTTFCVYLPVASEAETPESSEHAIDQAPGTGTVLLVEDEQAVAAVIEIGLRKAGYTVLKAADARQALDIARARPGKIDVLLTDVVLPGMSGRELSDRIVQFQSGVRVLFMSGYSDDAILHRGVEASSVAFIQKPFSVDSLTAKLRAILPPASRSD